MARKVGSKNKSLKQENFKVCKYSSDCEKCPLPDCKIGKRNIIYINAHLFTVV